MRFKTETRGSLPFPRTAYWWRELRALRRGFQLGERRENVMNSGRAGQDPLVSFNQQILTGSLLTTGKWTDRLLRWEPRCWILPRRTGWKARLNQRAGSPVSPGIGCSHSHAFRVGGGLLPKQRPAESSMDGTPPPGAGTRCSALLSRSISPRPTGFQIRMVLRVFSCYHIKTGTETTAKVQLLMHADLMTDNSHLAAFSISDDLYFGMKSPLSHWVEFH